MKTGYFDISKFVLLIIIVNTLLFFDLKGQNSDWVTLQDGKFYKGCEPFYPVMLNFFISPVKALDGSYYIATFNEHCPKINNGNEPCCGFSKTEQQERLKFELQEIVSPGFN
jgi:hypothetical protein